MLVNFVFKDMTEGKQGDMVVGEVQLMPAKMMTVRKDMGAHEEYAEFRADAEILELLDAAKEFHRQPTLLEAAVSGRSGGGMVPSAEKCVDCVEVGCNNNGLVLLFAGLSGSVAPQ